MFSRPLLYGYLDTLTLKVLFNRGSPRHLWLDDAWCRHPRKATQPCGSQLACNPEKHRQRRSSASPVITLGILSAVPWLPRASFVRS